MRKEDYELEARLIAIEAMVAHIYNVASRLAGAHEGLISEVQSKVLKAASLMPVSAAPSEVSDHLSSMVRDHLERIFQVARDERDAVGRE